MEPSRKESIKAEADDTADFEIFLDGSGHDNRIGSVAILYQKGRSGQRKTIQAYLGTADKHNTYEAEIIGAILVTWLLQNTIKRPSPYPSTWEQTYQRNSLKRTTVTQPQLTQKRMCLETTRLKSDLGGSKRSGCTLQDALGNP